MSAHTRNANGLSIRAVSLLTMTGLVSGLLTIVLRGVLAQLSLGTFGLDLARSFDAGVIFGGAIVGGLAMLQERAASTWKGCAFIAVSAAAYFASTTLSFGIFLNWPQAYAPASAPLTIPLPVFFCGGS